MEEAGGLVGSGGTAGTELGLTSSSRLGARDFRIKDKVQNEVESFSLAEDHLLFRFKSKEEMDTILHGGPWIVTGQLLAMEPGCWISC